MSKNNPNLNDAAEIKDDTSVDNKSQKEMVMVEKEAFDTLMEKVNSFEAFISESQSGPKPFSRSAQQAKPRQVKVHFFNGQLVVGYGKTFDRRDDNNNVKMWIELITEDGSIHPVKHEEFFSNPDNSPLCEILQVDKKKEVASQGETPATIVDWDKYRSYASDKMVSLEVVYVKSSYKVRLPDGKEVWLNEEVIN